VTSTTRTHCPAVTVPSITPCDPAELRPLVDFLAAGGATDTPIQFPRGTVLPDGRVDLCKQSIGPEGARLVLEALRETAAAKGQITAILFGTGAIGNAGAAAVADALDDGVGLETVYLGCNRIEDVGRLAEAVDRNGVDALWLKRNPLGATGATQLAAVIERGGPRVLDVYNCELDDDGVAAIAEALQSPACRVEHVYLGGNAAGPRAAAALGKLIATTTRLRSLQLSASRFEDCADVLAAGLARNRSLEELGLASCGLDARGAGAIARALRRHPRLIHLDMSLAPSARALGEPPNQIGDRGAPEWAELVRANGPLRILDLHDNGITSRGAFPMLEALHANDHLVELGLHHHVARTIRRAIRKKLDANATRRQRPGMPPHVAAIQSVYRAVPRP
jgi:Ran GTPase-activating protein (RanGAP) involved in mRNA processing and transport